MTIPEDVMKAARVAMQPLASRHETVEEWWVGDVSVGQIVANAILAERKRCAALMAHIAEYHDEALAEVLVDRIMSGEQP